MRFFRRFSARFYWQMAEWCSKTFVLVFSLYELYSRFMAKWQLNSLTRLISYCDCNFVFNISTVRLYVYIRFCIRISREREFFLVRLLLFLLLLVVYFVFMFVILAASIICLSSDEDSFARKMSWKKNTQIVQRHRKYFVCKYHRRQSVFLQFFFFTNSFSLLYILYRVDLTHIAP